jgi:uncharacterized protein YybS (DUF2232 family)
VNGKAASYRTLLLWSVVHLLILLTLAVPGLNVLSMHIALIPVLYLFSQTDLRRFLLTYAVNLIVLIAVLQGFGLQLAMLSVFFGIPAIVMGVIYKRKRPAQTAILAGGLTIVAEMILLLALSRLSGFDPIASFKNLLDESFKTVPPEMKGQLDTETLVKTIRSIFPLMMIFFAAYFSWITHVIGRWFLRKRGISIPALPPIRTWKLPKSLVWYFLALVVLQYMVISDSESLLSVAVLNLFPLMTFAFTVQALSFLFFTVHVRRWSKAIPWIAIVLLLVVRDSAYFFTMIGLLDTAFPLRDKISGKS